MREEGGQIQHPELFEDRFLMSKSCAFRDYFLHEYSGQVSAISHGDLSPQQIKALCKYAMYESRKKSRKPVPSFRYVP